MRAELYSQLFETRIARTEKDVRCAQRLRFISYCHERDYFDPKCYPEQLESDDVDERSVHALLVFRPTQRAVGCVRLVLPSSEFPAERVAPAGTFNRIAGFDRNRAAEISRLCILRSLGEDLAPGARRDPDLRRALHDAAIGLLHGILALSWENGVEHWCAIVTPSGLRRLARVGIRMTPVGAPFSHIGIRQAIVGRTEAIVDGFRKEHPHLWKKIVMPPQVPAGWPR